MYSSKIFLMHTRAPQPDNNLKTLYFKVQRSRLEKEQNFRKLSMDNQMSNLIGGSSFKGRSKPPI
jgi:hypothetical protein